MPTYSFICYNCDHKFDMSLSMSEYDKYHPKCKNCNCQNKKKVCRDLKLDLPHNITILSDNQLKLGHLAKRNASRLSNDEKSYITTKNNAYKNKPPERDLPSGMSRIKKDDSGERVISKKQRRKPNRKGR